MNLKITIILAILFFMATSFNMARADTFEDEEIILVSSKQTALLKLKKSQGDIQWQ